MTSQNQSHDRSTTDQILDLLLDALAERQKARRAGISPSATQPGLASPPPQARETIPPPRPEPPQAKQQRPVERPAPARPTPSPVPQREPEPGEEGWEPPARLPSIQMGKMLGRLAILVAVLVVLVNIPVTRYGISLARILPDTASLVIRDGLVLKGSGDEIYMLQDNKLRWISSMDAFEHLKLTWKDVHVVEDEYLEQFEMGHPIHLILKCEGSPHIYALENGKKRWIKDIDTFTAEGYVWDDVQFVTCPYLRNLPDGPSIPEDAGPPPQP
jgi:hypothetical protein